MDDPDEDANGRTLNLHLVGPSVERNLTSYRRPMMKGPMADVTGTHVLSHSFYKRPGTTDKGKEYEDLLTALLGFKLSQNKQVLNFHLSSNDSKYGSFDDIVLNIIYQDQTTESCAIQLKHKQSEEKKITKDMLGAPKGDFSLQKYFECYKDIQKKNRLDDNFKCVLYTNATFEPTEEFSFVLKNKEEIKLMVEKQQKTSSVDILDTSQNYCVYKFVLVDDKAVENAETEEYISFFSTFLFYTNQKNFEAMKILALELFKEENLCKENSFKIYTDFISSWSEVEGKKKSLVKAIIKLKIAEILLMPIRLPIQLITEENSKFVLFREASLLNDITLIETQEDCITKKLQEAFGYNMSDEDIKRGLKIGRELHLISKSTKSIDQVEAELVETILWHMKKVPLILRLDNDNEMMVKQAIRLCQQGNMLNRKFVLIGDNFNICAFKDLRVFQNLGDISSDSALYNEILRNQFVSLQGRTLTSLQTVITENEAMEKIVSAAELVKIFDGRLLVGEDVENLPDPYISQFLSRIVIHFNYFSDTRVKSVTVISCNNKLNNIKNRLNQIRNIVVYTAEEFLKKENTQEVVQFEPLNELLKKSETEKKHFEEAYYRIIVVAKGRCSSEEFRRICENNPRKTYHHIRICADNKLEWLESTGNIHELRRHRLTGYYIPESEVFSSTANKINVICGKPGTGKTTMTKFMKNQISSKYWIIKVNLREYVSYLQQNRSVEEALDYFLQDQARRNQYSCFTTTMRQAFVISKRVVCIWDGIDELPIECHATTVKIIKHVSITARDGLQLMLEEEFKVFALTIKEVDEELQKFHIKTCLKPMSDEIDLEEIVTSIMRFISVTGDRKFLGIPLHLSMLIELFKQDPEKYKKLLNNTFILPDLISYSVEEKFNVCFTKEMPKYGDVTTLQQEMEELYTSRRISQYELIALKTFIPKTHLDTLNIDSSSKLVEEIRLKNDRVGVITRINDDDETAIFVHNLYGEYFVASWLAKNFEHVATLATCFFDEVYSNIRLIFDMILAKNCPAHLAVLHKNYNNLVKNRDTICLYDKGGRSPLHLICSWCQRRSILSVRRNEDTFEIDTLSGHFLENDSLEDTKILQFLAGKVKCDPFQKDSLFQWTTIEYADNALSLLAIEVICRSCKVDLTTLEHFNECNILVYSIMFNYIKLLDSVEPIPYVEIKANESNLLHLATCYGRNDFLRKLLKNKNYQKQIDTKSNEKLPNIITKLTNKNVIFDILINLISRFHSTFSSDEYEIFTLQRTPLHIALSLEGNHEAVQILLEKKADTNIQANKGVTGLHLAASIGDLEMVQLLIRHGALLNQTDNFGNNALCYALVIYSFNNNKNHFETIKYLCKKDIDIIKALRYAVSLNLHDILEFILKQKRGPNINVLLNECFSLFFVAVANNQLEIVRCFIKNNIDVNATESTTNITALHVAVMKEHDSAAKVLIDNKAEVNATTTTDLFTSLYLAAINGQLHVVKLLLQKGADANKADKNGNTPLNSSIVMANSKKRQGLSFVATKQVCQFLIKNRTRYKVDINKQNFEGTSPLGTAAHVEDVELVTLLLECKANLNVETFYNFNPLHFVCVNGNKEIAKLLLKHGMDVNASMNSGETPLMLAAIYGNIKIAKILVKAGANVDAVIAGIEVNALHLAVFNGHLKLVRLLLPLLHYSNKTGSNSPFHLAIINNNVEICNFFIENLKLYNMNIDHQDTRGNSSLIIAVAMDSTEVAKILLENGANVHVKNDNNSTALHWAAHKGNLEIIRLLLNSGVDVNITDNQGGTPLLIAVQSGKKEAARLLIDNDGARHVRVIYRQQN